MVDAETCHIEDAASREEALAVLMGEQVR
jgi:hypothetical protein